MANRDFIAHVESFNNKFKILSRNLVKRYPDDEQILRTHKRINTVLGMDPLTLINKSGPYLYKYRDQIYKLNSGGEEFFMDIDDIKSSAPKDKVDIIDYIFPKVKATISSMPEDEKTEYKSMIIEMLDDYMEYLVVSRGIKI